MNAIISKGDKTAHLQLPVTNRQLAGAFAYLGDSCAASYFLKYNEENADGLMYCLQSSGVLENELTKVLPVGTKFCSLNDTLSKLNDLPYSNRVELENQIKVGGLETYDQLTKMIEQATPSTVESKFYFPLSVQLHTCNSWGDASEDSYDYDGEFAAKHEDAIRQALYAYNSSDEENMAEYFHGDNGVQSKLLSADWDFERKHGKLYGCVTVKTAGELTEGEETSLKDWITGQNSDGLGEGFEQREIYINGSRYGSFIYVSFWNFDDDYYVDNEDEFADRLNNQGMSMGGM